MKVILKKMKPKTNQITRLLEKTLARAKSPAWRVRQAILKAREERIKQIKQDAGLDLGV